MIGMYPQVLVNKIRQVLYPFAQSLRQAQILSLEILNVFVRLNLI